MTTVDSGQVTPVLKVTSVNASVDRAFEVFTRGFDSWWPRGHHIGPSPMKRAVIEGKAGGRCYAEQVDGTDCPWGQVLVWDPPKRLIIAWQITPQWQYEPDLAKASEVEVTFTPEAGGGTRIQLEHRYFERHGDGAAAMKAGVDSPNGWGGLLVLYAQKVEETNPLA
jgi:uncharacterized protein YndB with AHSA1/START domain